MLDEPDFNGQHVRNMEKLVAGVPTCKHFPILRKMALMLPMPIALRIAPGFAHMLEVWCSSPSAFNA